MEEIRLRTSEAQGEQDIVSFHEKNEKRKGEVLKRHGKGLRQYWREYCETTTISGFSYLVKDISLFERLWWLSVIVIGMTGSTIMIYQVLDKWNTTPVLVSLATLEMPIHDIPFPAVTVCPETKVSRSCLNYTEVLVAKKRGAEIFGNSQENAYFDYMSLLCRPENHDFPTEPQNATTGKDVRTGNYSEFLSKCSAVQIEDSMCIWMERYIPCKDIMTPIITDEGLCYSFNMLDVRDIYSDVNAMEYYYSDTRRVSWDPESGYDDESVNEFYPRRTFMTGADNSFIAVFFTKHSELNYACKDFALQGVRVSLHAPSNIPRPSQVFFSVGLNCLTNVAVNPALTQTSPQIREYTPEKRYCFFDHERKLKYFRLYSQSNCDMECWTNYTIQQCGCVSFYMPRDNSTQDCNVHDRHCIEKAKLTYIQNILSERLNENMDKDKKCNCLPLCSELTFSAEISSGNWDFKNPDDVQYDLYRNLINEYDASAVRIYMKNRYFLPTERNELYGVTDVISNTGGILGMFTGFSLISLAELVYFFSVKLVENYRRHGFWAGPVS